MRNIGDTGYIRYNNKTIKIKITEVHGNYIIVNTEDGEILGIPPESSTYIYKTREECEYYEERRNVWTDFIPMSAKLY